MTWEALIQGLAERLASAVLFYGHGTDNALDEAFYLVSSAAGLEPEAADDWLCADVDERSRERIEQLARRRIEERIPVAYLTGEAWFGGLAFHVDPRVLIPRSPLAELIADDFAGLLSGPPRRILDLCTGSGCIGIACAVQFPEAEVVLADIDEGALGVARRNCARHAVQDRVQTVQSDLFDFIAGSPFDLVITNPPYVSATEIAGLPAEYHHEPVLGLHSEEEGLQLPSRILEQAAAHLSPDGLLIMEVGHGWPALEDRHPELPFLWLSFEQGGEGVLALRREQLSTL